jgi:hypothetical protein
MEYRLMRYSFPLGNQDDTPAALRKELASGSNSNPIENMTWESFSGIPLPAASPDGQLSYSYALEQRVGRENWIFVKEFEPDPTPAESAS